MRSKGFDGMVCSIAGALAAMGDRWGLLILRDLTLGISRYEDFRRSTGITNATLSDRLKHLEASGLLTRRRYQVKPERYEYLLTAKGTQVAALMPVLAQLGDALGVCGTAQPPLVFVNRKTGAPVRSRFVDQHTGELLPAADVAVTAGPGADDLVRWRLSHLERAPLDTDDAAHPPTLAPGE